MTEYGEVMGRWAVGFADAVCAWFFRHEQHLEVGGCMQHLVEWL